MTQVYKQFTEKLATVKPQDAFRWIFREWRKECPAIEHKWIVDRLDHMTTYGNHRETSLINIVKMRQFSKMSPIDPTNYVCTVFRVTSPNDGLSANYGYLYSVDKAQHNKYAMVKAKKSPVFVKYCIAPALVSQDGEYRIRVLQYSQSKFLETMFPKLNAEIEQYILAKVESENLTLDHENFYPQLEIEQATQPLDDAIEHSRAKMKFFIHFWFIEIAMLSIGMQENHINPKFNRIFFRDVKKDIAFFKQLIKKFGKETVTQALRYISEPVSVLRAGDTIKYNITNYAIGQKFRPLNVNEVQEPFNIRYAPWREIYISRLATDLVVNFICPSFPVVLDWFYIKNSQQGRQGLYDNEQQSQRLEFSERAYTVVKKLRETQRLTYRADKEEARKFLNELFHQVYNKIDVPVDYAKSHLMMSNVTLGFMNEYVGRTFFDIPILAKASVWSSKVGNLLQDDTMWSKYMWDICYSLLSLNVKFGISHSDLHLNNATINTNTMAEIKSDDPKVMYSVMGYWFLFPTKGPYACLIDFSRAIISPQSVKDYHYFQESNEEFLEFIDHQNEFIVARLLDLFPTTVRPILPRLQEMLANDFDKIFKVYTAIDTYDFTSKLHKYLDGKASKKNLELLAKMQKISEHYLTNILLKVVNNPDVRIEWPIFQIMKECFVDFIIDPQKPRTDNIVDMWLLDRPVKYSLQKYDSFPPWLRDEQALYADGSSEKLEFFAMINDLRKKYEQYRKQSMKMIEFIAQRHREKYK